MADSSIKADIDTNTSTSSAQCAKCGTTGNLKRCAKCQTTQYCSRECQKGDWKNHKQACSRNAAARPATGSATSTSAGRNTMPNSSTPAPSKALSADLSKPFTALSEKKWLQNRPEQDVYKLLIDAYRLRLEDDYKFSGDVDDDSIYGGAPNGYAGFRRFLRRVEKKDGLLPRWWSREKQVACERLGRASGWSDLNSATGKSDIMEHYGNATIPMQMRMFVESVYGRGPGGQDGSAMLQLQVMSESGSIHSSALDMSGSMR
ncbi:hypothetical protein PV05_06621 [Exophiala xenobiotica]|uniref:MYND-type domain-containing protein n=1 Tax=Exophiala xenobiotica TaxID=348802 RepID=A0A0D2CVU9_9EURO|nr:uncharacterized protein PV05_06621 [Exophiala xenobiotica]KIW54252.1 hypothetical protein PV05_06621 [Exophiala xenobiotica]